MTTLNLFAARQLESISAKVQLKKYPEFKQRFFFPVNFEVNAGAETYTYYFLEEIGTAKIIADYSKDWGRISLKSQSFTAKIKGIGSEYGWNFQEARAAQMANMPLSDTEAMGARRANSQEERDIAFFGNDEYGLTGLFNHPSVPSGTATNDGTGSATTFASKTPAQILRDLNACANDIVTDTKEVEIPDTMLMPTAQYTLIASTPYSDSIATSILKMFLESNPYIKNVFPCEQCNAVDAFSGDDVMVAYRRAEDVLRLIVPQDFEQLPELMGPVRWNIKAHQRCGGLEIRLPLAINIVRGI